MRKFRITMQYLKKEEHPSASLTTQPYQSHQVRDDQDNEEQAVEEECRQNRGKHYRRDILP